MASAGCFTMAAQINTLAWQPLRYVESKPGQIAGVKNAEHEYRLFLAGNPLASVSRPGTVRIELQIFLPVTARFNIGAEFVAYKSQVVLGIGVFRIKLYGSPQMPTVLVVGAVFFQCTPKIEVRKHVVGMQVHGVSEKSYGIFQVSLFVGKRAQII